MRHAKPVWLETAPTSPDKSGLKPRGESVYLFLVSTIVDWFIGSLKRFSLSITLLSNTTGIQNPVSIGGAVDGARCPAYGFGLFRNWQKT